MLLADGQEAGVSEETKSGPIRTYDVVGMSCEHCVRAVRSELERVEGVQHVEVDLASGKVTVESERTLSDDEVAAAVDEAGYELAR
jgi:copper ion binding protein